MPLSFDANFSRTAAERQAAAVRLAFRLIAKMGIVIFCAEGLIMLGLSGFEFSLDPFAEALIDATALTLIVSPVTYLMLMKPYIYSLETAKEALIAQKAILDQHCLVSRTDARGRITYVNDEFCRVSGYMAEELIGQTHGIVNSGQHDRKFWTAMYRALAEKGIWQGDVCNRAKCGRLYWVHATNVAERDRKGKVIGYISARSNFTEQKLRELELARTQVELREAIKAAEAANNAKSAFLSTMSHEMRTPLNGVIGALQLLELEDLNPEQKALASVATQCSEALLVHINDVLDFSKIGAGHLTLLKEPFELRKLLESVSDIVVHKVKSQGSQIVIDIADSVPQFFVGDQLRLRQILLNFASNAAKFTTNGKITLSSVEQSRVSDVYSIEFSVADTGAGIAPDRLGDLFKEFSMIDSSFARQAEGTGLGLAISKSLVEAMGGTIGVESEVGKGSRFWFKIDLPRADAPTVQVTGKSYAPDKVLQILLVDDNATNRLVGSKLLGSVGHEVTLANSGAQAIEIAAERAFDVILMDISMPGMDGIEATRLLRKPGSRNADTPVVALTAHAVAGDRERLIEHGFNDYLSKPLRLDSLQTALAALVDGAKTAEPVLLTPKADPAAGPLLDREELDGLAEMTSQDVVLTVVEEFLSELEDRMGQVRDVIESKDLAKLQPLAHSIAGACASVGALRLSRLAKSIEIDCIEGRAASALSALAAFPPIADDTVAAYRSYASTVREALQQLSAAA